MSKASHPHNKSMKTLLIVVTAVLLLGAIFAYPMMSADRQPTSIQDEDWNVESAVYDSAGGMDVDIDEKIEEPVTPDMGSADSSDDDSSDKEEAHDTEQWKPNSGPLKGKTR